MAVAREKPRGLGVRRRLWAIACFVVIVLALALPVDWALQFLGTPTDRIINAGLVLALVALLGALGLAVSRWLAGLVLVSLVTASLFVRLLYFGLVHFSGQGFGPELFLHLEPESLRIVWHEYDNLVYQAAAVALLGAAAFWGMIHFAASRLRPWPTVAAALATLVALAVGREHLPEWQLWRAWQNWQAAGATVSASRTDDRFAALRDPEASMDEEMAVRWAATGLVETALPPRNEIKASTPAQPKNLVVLYVEALTTGIVEHPDYPGLMPNFRRLIREHGWIEGFHTSSFVTIEGVANTQCGLLFPFRGHGSGFAGRSMLAQALPCLGDVLSEAGYHQTYILGGGPLSFTGKGAFLDAHGFDDLKGWEYWRSHGHERAPGHWGMGDVETLEQVRRTIAERQAQDRPFNVTSLTVGSHLPGYVYAGCKPYGDGARRYLNALHCTDRIVAEWIERLEAEQLLEDTVLVIVGDHPIFANPEMHDLFGRAAYDSRLPLIVIGDELAPPRHERGAGFDLAPTLLDLLGIRHNARFAMGRSLAAPHDRPDYFVTRRGDIHRGEPIDNPARDCDPSDGAAQTGQPPSLPLSPCDKQDLLDLLHQLTMAYSHSPRGMDCNSDNPAQVRVPAGPVGPVEFRINDRDWSNRFSWRGRMTHPTEPGLYALGLDRKSRPVAATYLPADTVSGSRAEPLPDDIETAEIVLLAWRPEESKAVDLSGVLPTLPERQRGAAAWLVEPGRTDPIAQRAATDARAAVLTVEKSRCRALTR